MAYLCLQASPLVKAFLPEWNDKFMADPDVLIDMETKFTFDIPRGTASFRCKFNEPMEVRGRDNEEALNLYNWLVGGAHGTEFSETDCYGVVAFEPKIDLVSHLDEMSRLEELVSSDPKKAAKATAELKKLRDSSRDAVKGAREDAISRSRERILRAMKRSHNNLIKQWQINEEMKMGKYPPSVAELAGAHALTAEIEKSNEKTAKVMNKMSKLMQNQVVG